MEENVIDDELDNDVESQEQTNNRFDRPWLWKKGQSGNPGGRPKGSKSMKQWVKEMLESMPDEERQEFLKGLPKDIIWKMAEGNPDNKTEAKIEVENKVSNEDLVLAEEIKKLNARLEQNNTRTSEPSEGSTPDPLDREIQDKE